MKERPAQPHSPQQPDSRRRRRMLGAAGAALAGLSVAARAQDTGVSAPQTGAQVADAPHSTPTRDRVPYLGPHPAGVVTHRPASGMVASFFVLAKNPDELDRPFSHLSKRTPHPAQSVDH